MLIPAKGTFIVCVTGHLATVTATNDLIIYARHEGTGKEVLEDVRKVRILPNLGVGAVVEHKRFGRGTVLQVLSPLMVRVKFMRSIGREESASSESLMDTRNLRLLSPAPAPKTAKKGGEASA